MVAEPLGQWEPVCRCGPLGHWNGSVPSQLRASAWLSLASAGRCWDFARKIPPHLYAAAFTIHQGLQEEQTEDSDLVASCIPGVFTALTVVLLLWEAHDAPDSLLDTALHTLLTLESSMVAPAMGALKVAGVLDCSVYGRGEGWWPGVLDLRWLRRLTGRLSRKRMAWQTLADTGVEPWHEREVAEHQTWMKEPGRRQEHPSVGLCLCVMHGEGAGTLQSTLQSYHEGGLLELARRRFIAFLSPPGLEETVLCWRRKLAELFDLELLPETSWPETFIRKRQKFGDPGAAMAACAVACDQEYLLFLEDDFHLVTRPAELVRHRLEAAMFALKVGEEKQAPGRAAMLGVHLRHKLFFGPPFYEMLTALQHGEPPSPYTAWYFSSDPVGHAFPDNFWEPPFWDSGKECDSDRKSWYKTLHFQREPAFASEKSRGGEASPTDELAARVWWCSDGSSVLCTSTAAHRDPFRSLMYSTNPMLFRTAMWRLHIMSYMALLQDLRAVEETVTSSYSWRVEPTFELGLSLGLFRHQRIDRRLMPDPNEDELAAECVGEVEAG